MKNKQSSGVPEKTKLNKKIPAEVQAPVPAVGKNKQISSFPENAVQRKQQTTRKKKRHNSQTSEIKYEFKESVLYSYPYLGRYMYQWSFMYLL